MTGQERQSKDDPWAANVLPSPRAVRLPFHLTVYQAHICEASLMRLFLTLTNTAQNLHSELPLYSSEREEPPAPRTWGFLEGPGEGRPRKAVAWLLLLLHPSWAGRRRAPNQARVRSLGPTSQWPRWPTAHITYTMCVCIYMAVSVCVVSVLRLPARDGHTLQESLLARDESGPSWLLASYSSASGMPFSQDADLGGVPWISLKMRSRFSLLTNNCWETTAWCSLRCTLHQQDLLALT